MRTYLIYKLILIFVGLLSSNSLVASSYSEGIAIDSLGYTIRPSLISPDGNWVIASKTYGYNNRADTIFYINTKTKQKRIVNDLSTLQANLLYNDLMLDKNNQYLSVINLKKNQSVFKIDGIKQFASKAFDNKNLLITLSSNAILNIIQLDKDGEKNKTIFNDNQVVEFLVNENKTKLIYQKKDIIKSTFVLDLESFKVVEIDYSGDLLSPYWNVTQDKMAILEKENIIYLLDLEKKQVDSIQLNKKPLERFELSFYSNDDLFIKYNVKTEKKLEESEYLDIWNGNTRFVHPSSFKEKFVLQYKAFIYQYKTKTLKELKRKRESDLDFINLPNHILSYNPFTYQDFNASYTQIQFDVLNTTNSHIIRSIKTNNSKDIIASLCGKYMIYPIDKDKSKWEILELATNKTTMINCDASTVDVPIWSTNSEYVFFVVNNTLTRLHLSTKKQVSILSFTGKNTLIFANKTKHNNDINATINTDSAIVVAVKNSSNTLIYSIDNTHAKLLIDAKENDLSRGLTYLPNLISKDLKTIVFTQENYNVPVLLKVYNNGKIATLWESDIPQELYSNRKKQTISFKTKTGRELKGTLYYPKNFNKEVKYPMVVYTYAEDDTDSKQFLLSSLINSTGFNIPLLNDNGYFVFYVQSYISQQGPGIGALESIKNSVKVISEKESAIDTLKLGLIGHSFGGYKASFIATQTNMFSAIISGGAPHDIIGGTMYRYNTYRNKLDWFMVESGQLGFKQSYAENPEKYLANSPLLYAHKVRTPILLWTGLKDENAQWENTRKMYVALKRYKVPTIALFYKNVEHDVMPNQKVENKDLTLRVMDWFEYFLKDNRNIEWINKGIDYDNYSWNQLDTF